MLNVLLIIILVKTRKGCSVCRYRYISLQTYNSIVTLPRAHTSLGHKYRSEWWGSQSLSDCRPVRWCVGESTINVVICAYSTLATRIKQKKTERENSKFYILLFKNKN